MGNIPIQKKKTTKAEPTKQQATAPITTKTTKTITTTSDSPKIKASRGDTNLDTRRSIKEQLHSGGGGEETLFDIPTTTVIKKKKTLKVRQVPGKNYETNKPHIKKLNTFVEQIKADPRVYTVTVYQKYSDVNMNNDTNKKRGETKFNDCNQLLDYLIESKDKDGYRGNVIAGRRNVLKGALYLKAVPDIREMDTKIETARNNQEGHGNPPNENSWCIYVIWK